MVRYPTARKERAMVNVRRGKQGVRPGARFRPDQRASILFLNLEPHPTKAARSRIDLALDPEMRDKLEAWAARRRMTVTRALRAMVIKATFDFQAKDRTLKEALDLWRTRHPFPEYQNRGEALRGIIMDMLAADDRGVS